jgi:hypothetical protein
LSKSGWMFPASLWAGMKTETEGVSGAIAGDYSMKQAIQQKRGRG